MLSKISTRYLFLIFIVFSFTVVLIYDSQFLLSASTRQAEDKTSLPVIDVCPKFTRTDAVVLLTQRRSGSSVVGEIFNQRTDVSYFYEPLIPFGERPCDQLYQERVKALDSVLKCDFKILPDLYKHAFSVTGVNDKWAQCEKRHICFTAGGKNSQFLSRDTDICKAIPNAEGRHQCPTPFDTDRLSRHCKQGLLRAAKVIYLCRLEWLVPLLNDPAINVKVVHLVRDPRATIKSRVKDLSKGVGAVRYEATHICEQLGPNMIESNITLRDLIPRDKYLRIRHEDFSMDPVKVTQEVYDFIGINMNPGMEDFLIKTTSGDMGKKVSAQSTNRNATKVVSAWRTALSFKQVKEVQRHCEKPLRTLGYKIFENENDLRNVEEVKHF